MKSGETVELILTTEDLDVLMGALDMASIHYPWGRDDEVSAWRRMERRLGEIRYTVLDDTGPAEIVTDEYRSAPVTWADDHSELD